MKTVFVCLAVFCALLLVDGMFAASPSPAFSAALPTPTLSGDRAAGTERLDGWGIRQVWVPAGQFIAGSTPEQAEAAYQACLETWPGMCLRHEYAAEIDQHAVQLTYGFWIDQYEVTNAAYAVFVQQGGYTQCDYWSDEGWLWKGNRTGPNDPGCEREVLGPAMPRSCITWYEADAYARWRSGRLPTEAEWEYAARSTDGRLYPWGDAFDGSRLNYCDAVCPNAWRDTRFEDGAALTAPVGSYPAGRSWVGAYDLAGNVWEWTANWFSATYHQSGEEIDPTGPVTGIEKVLRGGSWNMPAVFSRTAYRDGVLPGSWSSIVGFRVVSTSDAGPPIP